MNITCIVWYQNVVQLLIYHKKLALYIFTIIFKNTWLSQRIYLKLPSMTFYAWLFWKVTLVNNYIYKKGIIFNTAWKMWIAVDNKMIFLFSDIWFKNRPTKTYFALRTSFLVFWYSNYMKKGNILTVPIDPSY